MPGGVFRLIEIAPRQLGRFEGTLRQRVGDALPHGFVLELRGLRELLAPTLTDGIGKCTAKVAEEGKRLGCAPLLSHEQHRYLRQQEIDGDDGAQGFGRSEGGDALTECAVADLIVVLNECDERRGRKRAARLTAWRTAKPHDLPLKSEALGQRAA